MNPHQTSEKGMRYAHSLPKKQGGEQMQMLMREIKRSLGKSKTGTETEASAIPPMFAIEHRSSVIRRGRFHDVE